MSSPRMVGRTEGIETGVHRTLGAMWRRFLNYINLCLGNKFRTLQSARMKNPLCRTGNVSGQMENWGQVDDEYCHAHSEYLRRAADISEKRARDGTFIRVFVAFVRREDPSVLLAIESILATGTLGDAAEFLGITDARFSRLRTGIRQLGKCFMTGDDHIPKQRKPCKKRVNV